MNDERSLGRPKGMLVLVRADVLRRKRGRIGLVEDLRRICRKILGLCLRICGLQKLQLGAGLGWG